MSITGLPGQGPVRVGIPVADLTSGLFLAQGILVALLEREKSGKGQWVHTSLLQAMVTMLDFQAARWLIDGEIPPQAGNDHPTGIPTGVFTTADGHIAALYDVSQALHRDRRAGADRRSALQESGRPVEEPQADERGARQDSREEAEAPSGSRRSIAPACPRGRS